MKELLEKAQASETRVSMMLLGNDSSSWTQWCDVVSVTPEVVEVKVALGGAMFFAIDSIVGLRFYSKA